MFPERPTRRGISFLGRSRASTEAPFMRSVTRMIAVAPPAAADGVAADPGVGCGGETAENSPELEDGACAAGTDFCGPLTAPGGMVRGPTLGCSWPGGGVMASILPWTPRS